MKTFLRILKSVSVGLVTTVVVKKIVKVIEVDEHVEDTSEAFAEMAETVGLSKNASEVIGGIVALIVRTIIEFGLTIMVSGACNKLFVM